MSISSSARAFRTGSWTPFARAASCMDLMNQSATLSGFTRNANTLAWGTSSQSSSRRLGVSSVVMLLKPVRLPPGRGETGDQPGPDWVSEAGKDDRDRGGCVF